jgi:hypothetical protein
LAPLIARNNWVNFNFVWKNNKWTKPLYRPSGVLASSTDPTTWSTYDAVIAAYDRGGFDGIGFVLEDDIGGFDLDDCRSLETGLIHPWAARLVERAGSYVEITVSGEGLRIIGLVEGGKVHIGDKFIDDTMKCAVYRRPEGRYIVITGNPLPESSPQLVNIDAVIDAVKIELDAIGDRPPDDDDDDDDDDDEDPGDAEELPQSLIALLHFPNLGAGERHGKFDSRHELAFAFFTGALRARISAKTIITACLDQDYRGCAIYEHCLANNGRSYVKRQIKQARDAINEGLDAEIVKINKTHALVLAGNKASVMKFEIIKDREQFRLLQVGAFKTWYANQSVTVGKKVMELGDFWIKHKDRREYNGIEFSPTGGRNGYYNMWRGFAVEPREGDCSKFLGHLKDNVAQGKDLYYRWIVGWFAQIVQQLDTKMGTSLGLRGKQGVGKTKVGEVFGSLFGNHYELVSDPRYITGQFNSHMASLIVLHADEAFWAGDKRAEGKLKDLVTGSKHRLEFKSVDPILVDNYIRLLVTGNQEWLVPAGFGERRFAVFDVGEGKIKNSNYFAAIDDEMNNGGREALLHHLLNFDLSRAGDLRTIPHTNALFEQIVESASPEQAWWLDTLKRGELPCGINELNTCPKVALFRRYLHHAQFQGVRRKSIETRIGIFLTKYVGPDLKGDEKKTYTIRRGTRNIQVFSWIYRFPSLWDCRKRFAREMQQTINWGPDPENTQWGHEPLTVLDDDDPWIEL